MYSDTFKCGSSLNATTHRENWWSYSATCDYEDGQTQDIATKVEWCKVNWIDMSFTWNLNVEFLFAFRQWTVKIRYSVLIYLVLDTANWLEYILLLIGVAGASYFFVSNK